MMQNSFEQLLSAKYDVYLVLQQSGILHYLINYD